ncbi:hypothetical protein [Magnetovirga frankeli]|uniref:hypothetical protein n=1 Tax=Magnetovirga frankeli TaxID=947516 RepID=UPI003D34451A
MKRNIMMAVGLIATTVSLPAIAWDYSNDPYDSSGNPNYRYQGSGGTQYQYDLSRPSDQIRYETDVRAQMRDELSVDPRRELDQGLGRYGGGIRR